MSIWESIILGLIQGLAEFLPISSSGHLAIMQDFFGIQEGSVLMYTVLLHFGTLVAVFFVYRHTIWALVKELGALIKDVFTGKGLRAKSNDTRKLGIMIIIASIPAAFCGILFDKWVERAFSSIVMVGICLMITGTILFFAERLGKGGRDLPRANFRNAFAIGIFQAVALLPGISRSGSCLTGGLLLGFTRELAVKFAFLISIPTVLGAVVLEIPSALKAGVASDMLIPCLVGIVVSALSGYAAIKVMIRIVSGKKLFIFSVYTWITGAAVLIYTLLTR
jgi:undecaprenyl-diphosphatase